LLQNRLAILAVEVVLVLDQQPVVALAALAVVAHAHQNPAALQLAAGERELEIALAQRRIDVAVALRRPEPAVPEHDGAAAVLALGDRAFEVAIVERVVLDLDGQALVGRV
jgi:hypothetical protein